MIKKKNRISNDNIIEKVAMMSVEEKNKLKKKEEIAKELAISNKGRQFKLKILKYEINEEDSDITVICKKLINKSKVTNRDVYDVFGRSDGWNLIYSSEKNITWDKAKKWGEVLGYDVVIDFIKK